MDLFFPSAAMIAFWVIHELFRQLNPPWMAFAFTAAIVAVLWLDILNVGLFHKLFPSVPTVLVVAATALMLGVEAWDWRRRSQSQE
jgi:hypothetical protein